MRLRKQLFLLSLITLSLPWIGCQAIREMDSTLRLAQVNALEATASAVAARFASDPRLTEALEFSVHDAESLYAHQLASPIDVDGYGEDDWLGQNILISPALANNIPNDSAALSLALGRRADTLYVFAQIDTETIRYFRPSQSDLRGSDWVLVETAEKRYALFASAPGRLQAIAVDGDMKVNDRATVHQVSGYWLESKKGFQLELSMPYALAKNGLRFRHITPSENTLPENSAPLPRLTTPSAMLSDELAVFSAFHTRLHITNPQRFRLASAGALQAQNPTFNTHGLLGWVYRLALGKRSFPKLSDELSDGRLQAEGITPALDEGRNHYWYQQNGRTVVQAVVNIVGDGKSLGAVVAEQSEESLTRMTNNAFGRLLAYSFLASIAAVICLVGYATFLSTRIRRLNDAALTAIGDSGVITEHFPTSKSSDEIGELSRSYAQLLGRLREYTHYLRTLSSKLSHELRTPLAIVRSSLDNLEQEKLSEEAYVYAQRALEGSSRLSHILNAMSAASRVEQAIEVAETELIKCDELMNSLVSAYRSVYHRVSFSLTIDADPSQLMAMGSGELLVQALDKLVDNANDFSPPEGLIRLMLEERGGYVIFSVQNQGPPLPESMRGQLFDSMVSVREGKSDSSEHHLGLGLFIVRLIAEFHSGEVNAYNAEDSTGAVFQLKIPKHSVGATKDTLG